MTTHRYRVVGPIALVVAAACAVVTPNVALAAQPSPAGAVSAAPAAQEEPIPLKEAATADSSGSFYTLDNVEYKKATTPANQGGSGFKAKQDSATAGITMFKDQVPGSVPIYRLRLKNGHQSYLLSKDPAKEVHPERFDNEGPVGYLYEKQRPGTVALERYSKNEDWRVAREGRNDLTRAGYGQDGVLGYFVPLKK
jgi:hypothetical protein